MEVGQYDKDDKRQLEQESRVVETKTKMLLKISIFNTQEIQLSPKTESQHGQSPGLIQEKKKVVDIALILSERFFQRYLFCYIKLKCMIVSLQDFKGTKIY